MVLKEGFLWRLRDGVSIDVWKQPWLWSTTNAFIETPMYPSMETLKVSDLIDSLGSSNVPLIDHLFYHGDVQSIRCVPIMDRSRRDKCIWGH